MLEVVQCCDKEGEIVTVREVRIDVCVVRNTLWHIRYFINLCAVGPEIVDLSWFIVDPSTNTL